MTLHTDPTTLRTTLVAEIPACNLCKDGTPAEFDTPTRFGPWAFLCRPCWAEIGQPGKIGTRLQQA